MCVCRIGHATETRTRTKGPSQSWWLLRAVNAGAHPLLFLCAFRPNCLLLRCVCGGRSERSRWEKSVVEQGILSGRSRFTFSLKSGNFPLMLSSVLPPSSEREASGKETKEGKKQHRKNRSFSSTFDLLSGRRCSFMKLRRCSS